MANHVIKLFSFNWDSIMQVRTDRIQNQKQLACQNGRSGVPFGDKGAFTKAANSSSTDIAAVVSLGSSNISVRPYCSSRVCHFSAKSSAGTLEAVGAAHARYSVIYNNHQLKTSTDNKTNRFFDNTLGLFNIIRFPVFSNP